MQILSKYAIVIMVFYVLEYNARKAEEIIYEKICDLSGCGL